MSKKAGSEGMTRQTTAEWAADTKLYPEGHRLMDTETGTVRVSKGGTIGTYALAWVPSTGGSSAWGGITGTLSDQTDLQNILETHANAIGAIVVGTITNGETTTAPSENAVFDALALKANNHRINGTASPTSFIDVRTGTTDVFGEVVFNLSAYSSVTLITGLALDTNSFQPSALDITLSAYRLGFADTSGSAFNGDIIAIFLCIP